MTLSTTMKTPATSNRNGDRSTNVKVVVRVRPENTAEHNAASRIVVRAMNEHVLVFDPKDEQVHTPGVQRKVKRDITKRARKDLKFAFDFVFGPHSSNQSVYEQTTKTILDGFINGYNCSVFAYGATGAGKTHTMLGNEKKPGVMFLTMVDLYERIAAIREEKSCEVAVSYLEVYNEQIKDLLLPQGQLPIREDSMNGVVIQGLSLHKPKSAEELLYMLQYGNKNRSQHPTDANAESSRSHAVFQVFMKQQDRTANISAEVKVAKMCLVDLAGSERATVTTNRGVRFREGANINKSLLALGNVINALADNKSKGHVPYRDSKLTRILKDSLGGNCRTVMIAAVSPSSMSFDDTYNTLKYADRAKNISATLKKNILNVDFHVVRYGQIVEDLRKEIVELKSKLGRYEEGKVVAGGMSVRNSFHEEVVRLQDVLHKVFVSRLAVRKELLENEITKRDVLWKIHKKEKVKNRLNILVEESQVCDNIQRTVKKSRNRLDLVDKQMIIAGGKYEENCAWLNRVTDEMKMAGGDTKVIPEMLEVSLRMHQLEVELGDSRFYLKHLKKLVKNQEKSLESNDRLIMSLLQLVKKQHLTIKGHNLLTSELETDYENVQKEINSPEVSWADETNPSEPEEEKFHISDIINLPVISLLSLKGPTPSRVRNNRRSVSSENSTPKLPKDNTNKAERSNPVIKENMEPRRVLSKNIDPLEPKKQNNPIRPGSGLPESMEPRRVLADNVNPVEPKRPNIANPSRIASGEPTRKALETNTSDLDGTFTLEEPKVISHPVAAPKSSNKDSLRRAVLSANTFNQKPFDTEDNTKNSQNSNKADERVIPNDNKVQTVSEACSATPITDSNIVNSYKARDDRPITPKRSYHIPNQTFENVEDSSVSKLINSTKLSSGEDFLTPKKSQTILNSLENESPATPKLPDSIVKSYSARDERPITPKASYDFSSGISSYQAREERPITPKASYDPSGFDLPEGNAQNIVKNLDATFVKATADTKHLNATYVMSVPKDSPDQTITITSPKVLRENMNICNVNSSTVTKVNSATVTKSAPYKFGVLSPEQEVRNPVARSIKFESTPPSGNGMSYADAVKTPSPVRTPLLQITNNTGTNENRFNITPLQSKMNLDACTPNLRLSNKFKENLKKLRQKVENSMSTSKQIGRNQPNYMSLTKSAKSRNRLNFKDGGDDNMAPRRIPFKAKTSSSNPPRRNPWRSKSATSLPRSGWQI